MTVLAKAKFSLSRKEAERRTAARKRECKKLESGWIGLGRAVRKDLKDGVPAALGVTEAVWMVSTFGASLARLKRARRIEQALSAVPDKKLKRLPESNAYELTRLPEKQRQDPKWLKRAEKTPVKEFKEAVETERERITGMPRESRKTWWIALPVDVYAQMQEAEAKVAGMLGLEIEDEKSGNRATVWEALAQFVLQTPVEHLRIEITGGEDAAANG